MNVIEEACKYAQRGWKVFPLISGSKKPIDKGGFHNATDDIEAICTWDTKCNLGIATGSVSGFWVLDVDIKGESNGVESIKKAIAKYGDLPETLVQQTASGGYHYFFKQPSFEWISGTNADLGIDVRADRGYIVAPPSTLIKNKNHEAGSYTWLTQYEIAVAPQWLYDWVRNSKKKIQNNFREGGRNCRLTSIAGYHRAKSGFDFEQLLELLKLENQKNDPPLDLAEVETIAKSVSQYDPGNVPIDFFDTKKILDIVTPMGIHENNYVFYSKETRCMSFLSPTALSKKENLESLCDYSILDEIFPGEKSYNAIKARRLFMQECKAKGLYDPVMLAGVGIWKEKETGNIVVNTGDQLIVNGIAKDYADYTSDVSYAQLGKKIIDLDLKLSDDDIQVILDIITNYPWKEDYYKYLILGAIIQGVIGTALRWRSHLWIIGAYGTGKSTIQKSFIQVMLGKLCKNFAGKSTTEAGIRQTIGEDGFTVSIDDIDGGIKDIDKINSIIELARICSSDEQTLTKGSATGRAIQYRCQSPFIISSIKPYLNDPADVSRFCIVELKEPSRNYEQKKHDKEDFKMIEKKMRNHITPDLSKRWVSFCINNFTQIQELIEDTKDILDEMGFDGRERDQWAGLLGPARLLVDIDFEFLKDVLQEQHEDDGDEDNESMTALNRLLDSFVKIPTKFNPEEMTLRNVFTLLDKDFILDSKYDKEEITRRMYSYGFKIVEIAKAGEKTQKYLYLSKKSDYIKTILGPSWGKPLTRISWVTAGNGSQSFGSRHNIASVLKIPLDKIIYEDVNTLISGF